MKCPNCGAEIEVGNKYCKFCGTPITAEMQKEQERLNKAGCPNCGSTNITFDREKQAEVHNKKKTAVIRKTVGVCKDCGHTWTVENSGSRRRSKTWLWVLGWIFIFPVPLTILMLRPSTKLSKKMRYGIIAVSWVVYALWMIIGNISNKRSARELREAMAASTEAAVKGEPEASTAVETTVKETTAKETTAAMMETVTEENHLYDRAEIRDIMNGIRTEKIGEYAVIRAEYDECTMESVADVYYNFFEKNELNWLAILYTDADEAYGVYINKGMIVANVGWEKDQRGDYSGVDTEYEVLYVPAGDGKTIKQVDMEKEETTDESAEASKDPSAIDPDLKAFLDSYEAFMDEYCEFMENYNASDMSQLVKYTELLAKMQVFAEKIQAYDSEELSGADLAYYVEVMARIEGKLLKITYQ